MVEKVYGSDRLQTKVLDVLKNPSIFPPELSAWVRGQVARNPTVRIDAFQLPATDRKHLVGSVGEPAFQNSWVNYGGQYEVASFSKNLSGEIRLQGLVKNGVVTAGTPIFTLPPGYRPSATLLFVTISNQALSRVDVAADGTVQVQIGTTPWISLSGITFRT